MAVSGKTARRLLSFLLTTDPPEIHSAAELLANQLDNDVEGGQGKLSERPAAKLRGRVYVVEGDATAANNGIIWWDNGTTWVALNRSVQVQSGSPRPFLSWGNVDVTGTVKGGSGDFTVSKVGTGKYEIVWAKEKGSLTYALVASAISLGGPKMVACFLSGVFNADIEISNSAGTLVDSAFTFTAIAAT
jgi:hypothetical protein